MRDHRPTFIWPRPLADQVFVKIHRWNQEYYRPSRYSHKQSERVHGTPLSFRKRTDPSAPERDPEITRETVRHQIIFTLNEIRWLYQTFREEGPNSVVTNALKKSLDLHERALATGHAAAGAGAAHGLLFTKEEIDLMYRILDAIRRGAKTPAQEEYDRKSIEEPW